MSFNIERMLRFNGKKPTPRERWKALYRLFRIANKIDEHRNTHDASDCLRVLGFNSWIAGLRDARGEAEGYPRSAIPLFLRKRFLDMAIRKRLYGKHPEWEERDKKVAGYLHSTGMEVTPREVGEVRQKLLRLAKDKAVECGFDLPNDDNQILKLIYKQSSTEGTRS